MTARKPQPLPSDDYVREHAYLVERGVRAMALVQTVEDGEEAHRALNRLECLNPPGVIVFAVRRQSWVDLGFASAAWAVKLYEWSWRQEVPAEHRHRIVGLLLGYSIEAIKRHEERWSVGGLA